MSLVVASDCGKDWYKKFWFNNVVMLAEEGKPCEAKKTFVQK